MRAPTENMGGVRRAASRNRARIAGGTLLVVACALGAAVVYGGVSHRRPMLALAHPVAAGQVIRETDLGEVLVSADSGVGLVPAGERESFVGRVAAVDLVAGSLLSSRQVTDGKSSTAGKAVVGAALKDGQYPLDITDGDLVWLVPLPAPASDSAGDPAPLQDKVDAVVVAVRDAKDAASLNVSLAVSPGNADRVAVAAARGDITIVKRPR